MVSPNTNSTEAVKGSAFAQPLMPKSTPISI